MDCVDQMYKDLMAAEEKYNAEQEALWKKYGVKDIYREYAAMGTRWLYEQGFSPAGDAGDVSIRDPETGLVYISASPIEINYHNLGEYHNVDMAVVDMDGNRITKWSRPTVEMPMHLEILKAHPDYHCVVHTHGPWSSVFAMAGMDIPLLLAEQVGYLGPDPIKCPKEYGKVGSQRLGEIMNEALGRNKAALMRNHGAVALGKDLYDGFKSAHFLEDVCKKTIFTLLLGQTADLDINEIYDPWFGKTFED